MWVCGNCARDFRVLFYVLILDWFMFWIGWVGAGDVAAGAFLDGGVVEIACK